MLLRGAVVQWGRRKQRLLEAGGGAVAAATHPYYSPTLKGVQHGDFERRPLKEGAVGGAAGGVGGAEVGTELNRVVTGGEAAQTAAARQGGENQEPFSRLLASLCLLKNISTIGKMSIPQHSSTYEGVIVLQ